MAAFRELRTRLGLRRKPTIPIPDRKQKTTPDGVSIGRRTYRVGPDSFQGCSAEPPVRIGPFCSIAAEVLFIGAGEHRKTTAATFPLGPRVFRTEEDPISMRSKGPIVVGPDVWIGRRAIILSGVTIGAGAIIGAGSVVTRDIPAYTLAAGNPARTIKTRFPQDIIDQMLTIAWWDWPDDKLQAELASFDLPIAEFARLHQGSVRQIEGLGDVG